MSRHPEDLTATPRRTAPILLDVARRWILRHPALSGSLVVASAYGLMQMGWRSGLEAALVYCIGAQLLTSLSRDNGRSRWLAQAWNLAFVVDLGVKAFLFAVYKSPPDSALVIEGISNTNGSESTEFLLNYWQLLGTFTLQGLALAVLLILATHASKPRRHVTPLRVLLLVGLFGLLHLDPAVRRANPFVFWSVQAATIEEFRANVETLREKRDIALASLIDWQPRFIGPAQHTVGLVIGESTNRWNWQLYGYERPTTPELARQEDQLLVFRDVISAASSTVSSFRYMLTSRALQDPAEDEARPSVLLLARAAGYKVFWITNQHDLYIKTRFAEEADVVQQLNVPTPGVPSLERRSLDERVLPGWREALADPAPRKLIVVHLMGAHAHYDLRSPDDMRPFETTEDLVDQQLAEQGRPEWVRLKRDQYDEAMLYQDRVISRLLDDFRRAVSGTSGAWLYTSDHGQEVGHTRDFTGHSPDEPGQVVPLLVWDTQGITPERKHRLEWRPFQTDALDWTLLDLLQIRTARDQPGDWLLQNTFLPRERTLQDGTAYVPSPGTLQARHETR